MRGANVFLFLEAQDNPRLRGSEPHTQTPEGGRAPLVLGSWAITDLPEARGRPALRKCREQLASLSTLSNLCVFFERRQERHSCFLLNAFMSMEMRGFQSLIMELAADTSQ